MSEKYKERTKIIIGQEGCDTLKNSSVLIFGVGGVGSFVVESLARAGVGSITVVDFDTVDETNINRQIPALYSTIGKYKVDVIEERVKDINPEINFSKHRLLFDEDTKDEILKGDYDFVVDAIDMVKSKICLIVEAQKRGYEVISSMGMGNKLDPSKIRIADIYKTKTCPLARVMRRELKLRGVKKLTTVYSEELPSKTGKFLVDGKIKNVNGSISFVPSSAGLLISSFIVRKLLGEI